jgi:serpin B
MDHQPARTSGAVDAFGADLYALLTEQAPDVVFSPASVAGALGMALAGARGRTAAELQAALHLTGPPGAGPPSLPALRSGGTPDPSVTLRAPSLLWVQSGLALRPEFTALLAASAVEADFAHAPEAARSEINRVIAEQTEGKITGLLPPGVVSVLTRLLITSAVYLKAAWTEPFAESDTTSAPFYPDGQDRPSMTVPMMRAASARSYVRGDGYQAVMLPYRGGLAMAVVLPDGPVAALREKLSAGGLAGLLAGAARSRVRLSLPRFRLQTSAELVPVLQRLGVREAFTDGADFSGITGQARLLIDAIMHQAYVEVDEHGTEAAAATGMIFRPTAAFPAVNQVTMTVDRPFLFAIIHVATDLPLFLGQVSHPRQGGKLRQDC